MYLAFSWILAASIGSISASANSDAIWQIVESEQVIHSAGVSVREGQQPDYDARLRGLALRTSCRVWLRLEQGSGVEVRHEDCPSDLQPAMDQSLLTSQWQQTGSSSLAGWLPLRVAHSKTKSTASGVRAVFRPHALHAIVKQVAPRTMEGDPQRCTATIQVSTTGKPSEIHVEGCDASRAEHVESTLRKWRWTPLKVGKEARAFETHVTIGL